MEERGQDRMWLCQLGTVYRVTEICSKIKTALTLGSHQYHWNFTSVTIVCHPAVVVVNSLEADFIFQAEDKYNSIHPHGKLQDKNGKGIV